MVQISGVYQLRWVVEIPIIYRVWDTSQVVFLRFLNHQHYEALISGGGSLGGGRFTSHKEIDRHHRTVTAQG